MNKTKALIALGVACLAFSMAAFLPNREPGPNDLHMIIVDWLNRAETAKTQQLQDEREAFRATLEEAAGAIAAGDIGLLAATNEILEYMRVHRPDYERGIRFSSGLAPRPMMARRLLVEVVAQHHLSDAHLDVLLGELKMAFDVPEPTPEILEAESASPLDPALIQE